MQKGASKKIQFHYLYERFYFPQRNKIKAFLLLQLQMEGKQLDTINYIFCTDDYLLQLNQQHLRHNTYTDIITFELSSKKEKLLADIYISIDRVKENAVSYKTHFSKELMRVVFHGALHLCGYKDKTKKDTQLMRTKEDEWLVRFGVSREIKPVKD